MTNSLFGVFHLFLIHARRLLQFVPHVFSGIPWPKNLNAWSVRHEDGVHLEIDHHIDAKGAAAILFILLDNRLRGMDRLCLDVFALLTVRPEDDFPRRAVDVFAHTHHIAPVSSVMSTCFSRSTALVRPSFLLMRLSSCSMERTPSYPTRRRFETRSFHHAMSWP